MSKRLPILFFILVLLTLNTTPVSAETPRRYYDWSATLETNQMQVLGVKVFAQETPESTEEATPTEVQPAESTAPAPQPAESQPPPTL